MKPADLEIPIQEGADCLALEEAVGQMLMIGFRGDVLDGDIAAILRDIQPGGVVLFDYDLPSKGEVVRNITSPRQLRTLTSALQGIAPYFIAVDAEGGYVNRLKKKYGFAVSVPSAQKLGRKSPGKTKRVADALARELKDMGINWNFAPVVDVNIDPKSPAIGAIERSFSDVPRTVVAHANAFVKAHQRTAGDTDAETLSRTRKCCGRYTSRCYRCHGDIPTCERAFAVSKIYPKRL